MYKILIVLLASIYTSLTLAAENAEKPVTVQTDKITVGKALNCDSIVYIADANAKNLEVRTGPDNHSPLLAVIPKNPYDNTVALSAAFGDWVKLVETDQWQSRVEGRTHTRAFRPLGGGWIFAPLLATRVAAKTKIYAEPSANAAVLESFPIETEVNLQSCAGNWLKIKYKETVGWIKAPPIVSEKFNSPIVETLPGKALRCDHIAYLDEIDVKGLEIHSGPDKKYPVIATILPEQRGKMVILVAGHESWVKIVETEVSAEETEDNSVPQPEIALWKQLLDEEAGVFTLGKRFTEGWIYAPSLVAYTTPPKAKLYAKPTLESAVVGEVPSLAKVHLQGCAGDWLEIKHAELAGWLGPSDIVIPKKVSMQMNTVGTGWYKDSTIDALHCENIIANVADNPEGAKTSEYLEIHSSPSGAVFAIIPKIIKEWQVVPGAEPTSKNYQEKRLKTTVTITASRDKWVLIEDAVAEEKKYWKGIFYGSGWIESPTFLTITTSSITPAVLYTEPTHDSTVVGSIPSNTETSLLSCAGDWVKVQHSKLTGWMKWTPPDEESPTKLTTETQSEQVELMAGKAVSCDGLAYITDPDPKGLNVRSGPGNDYPIIAVVPKHPRGSEADGYDNIVVTLTAANDQWLLITNAEVDKGEIGEGETVFDGKGWVYAPLLGISTRLREANLYAEPSQQASVLGKIPAKTQQIKLLDCADDWVKVEYMDKLTGWMAPADKCTTLVGDCGIYGWESVPKIQ
ncbi:MAG: hypothetical protein BWK79_12150 [Beggiatoa sp. IS2]|nr:MAG: hypothetical protein BWK79_12150 [Beggiatoa sp. IS2]